MANHPNRSRRHPHIVRAYIRHYRDNDQTTAYSEWSDGSTTEGAPPAGDPILGYRANAGHMEALFAAAVRAGLAIERETW